MEKKLTEAHMGSFTLFDGIAIAIIVVSALLAYSRGFLREFIAIIGWIIAAIIAFKLTTAARPLVEQLPAIGPVLQSSCVLATGVTFTLLFAIGLIILALFTPLVSAVVNRSVLSGIDQGLGLAFGVFRGMFLIAIIVIIYNAFGNELGLDVIADSYSASIFTDSGSWFMALFPEDLAGSISESTSGLLESCRT